MLFRTSSSDTGSSAATNGVSTSRVAADLPRPLDASELRRRVDAAGLGFATTAELEPIDGLIGQERALKAIEFATDIASPAFNLFVLGPPAAGKSTAVRAFLEKRARAQTAPDDWAYVNSFDNPNRPRALRLPHGRARSFAKAMVTAVDELRNSVPALFESEDYQARRRTIEEAFRAGQEAAFEALNKKAMDQNIAILRTPTGFAMAPMHEGKVVKPEVFNALPESMRQEVQTRIEALQGELEKILEHVPKSDKQRHAQLRELNEETARASVREALDDVEAAFKDLPDVMAYLSLVGNDLVRNVGLFLVNPEEEQQQIVKQPADTARDARFRRYMVNIMVTNGGDGGAEGAPASGAPIVEEANPNYANLIGRVEHIAHMGTLVTDFLLMKPGALHRANGGYLMLDARKVLLSPFAWEALKRALAGREIKIEQPSEMNALMSTQSLDPEPIPLDVKVVLIGDRQLYYMLAAMDPDFPGLFKVQADFDDNIVRSGDNDHAYARVITSINDRHGLPPMTAAGVARVIEEAARLAGDRERLSIQIGRIGDVVHEAAHWARQAGREQVTETEVARAIDEHTQRADRMRDRTQESIVRGIVMVDTAGSKVGQINGLSVLQLGDFAFGRPSRITARVRMGAGRVTDIEREVNLGGPLHSKGVMILWGYLAGRYAQEVPLALAASLVFEQSYGGVDGDSASSAELYALLSALSEVPIRQGFAVTGSVNQNGEVQAIGGANEKIEGYFDVCRAKGFNGEQGVLLPRSNVQHLMLRTDVVEAVEAGKFTVHAVDCIDRGMELLTGVAAGERRADGKFPPGTINRLVEDKLTTFAVRGRSFSQAKGSGSEATSGRFNWKFWS